MWSDPVIVNDLLKKGLLLRIYEPQVHVDGDAWLWVSCGKIVLTYYAIALTRCTCEMQLIIGGFLQALNQNGAGNHSAQAVSKMEDLGSITAK